MPNDRVRIRLETEGAAQAAGDIGKVDAAAQQLGETTKGVALGSFLGEVAEGAAREAVAQLEHYARAAMDLADRLDDLSGKAGVPARELQTIGNAASLGTGSFEDVAQAMLVLRRSMADAELGSKPMLAAFERLKITAADLKGLSPDAVFYKIADAMKEGAGDGRALDDALTVIGKSGANLASTMEMGSAAIKKTGSEMGLFGGVTVAELGKAKDEITKFQNQLTVMAGTALVAFKLAGGKLGAAGAAQLFTELQNPIYGASKAVLLLRDGFKEAGKSMDDAVKKDRELALTEEQRKQMQEDQAAAFKEAAAMAADYLKEVEALERGTEWMRQPNPQLEQADRAAAKIKAQIEIETARAEGRTKDAEAAQRLLDIEEETLKLKADGITTDEVARDLATKLVDAKQKAKETEEANAKAANAAADAAEREKNAREAMARMKAQQGVTAAEEALAKAEAGSSKQAIRKAQQGLTEAKQFEKLTGEGIDPETAAARAKAYAKNVARKGLRDAGVIGGEVDAAPGVDITKGGQFDRFGKRVPGAPGAAPAVVGAPVPAAPGADLTDAGRKLGEGGGALTAGAGELRGAVTQVKAGAEQLTNVAGLIASEFAGLKARLAAVENKLASVPDSMSR